MFKKRLSKIAGVLPILGLFAGCSMQSYYLPNRAAYHPTKSAEAQNRDDSECKQFASDRTGGYDPNKAAASGALTEGAIGGIGGAVLGGVLGGVWGGSRGAGLGAGTGAISGGAGGALHGAAGELNRMHSLYTRQYSTCMRAKEYIVE